MKKSPSYSLRSGLLAAAAVLLFGTPAQAQAIACGAYQPGMLAFVTGIRPAPCAYQGDYIVNQGPAYTGPARIAPQSTYAPNQMAADYPYVRGQLNIARAPAAERAVVRRTTAKRAAVKSTGKRMTVNVKNDLPPRKGKVQTVHARAEVRIYGPERMDIRLYRR